MKNPTTTRRQGESVMKHSFLLFFSFIIPFFFLFFTYLITEALTLALIIFSFPSRLHMSTLLFLHCCFTHMQLSHACQLVDRTLSLLSCHHVFFYIALLFTHLIPIALLMDMSDSYCIFSWLQCKILPMVSFLICI
ncbi:hypothetical protein J3R30DRAFT_1620744 [Lentinula aciculospora]|uniref:Uncharacterized protein n=1 Tax=Lentinula aciculospora TaxID=153920 RepID=A0A9W8ZXT2_9AGAR|nr:hypothetical protein J3R30DRAFT_1620744 [Lentinula aciculospora]